VVALNVHIKFLIEEYRHKHARVSQLSRTTFTRPVQTLRPESVSTSCTYNDVDIKALCMCVVTNLAVNIIEVIKNSLTILHNFYKL
jgi:hypothetical protein